MTHNIGEEIAGTYLKVCKDCDFVEYNLYTTEVQGEIDVVGINTKNKRANDFYNFLPLKIQNFLVLKHLHLC